MQQKQNFRVSQGPSEIFSHLEKAKAQNSPITLWQNIKDKRTISFGTLKHIDANERTMLLTPHDDVHLSFQKEVTLYIKVDYYNILFKGTAKFLHKSLISIKLPEEFHLLDYRAQNRRKLKLSPQNNLQLIVHTPLSPKPLTFEIPILDISPTGLSLLTDAQQIKVLKEGMNVQIKKLGQQLLNPPLDSNIVYIVPMNEAIRIKNLQSYRIGMKFAQTIPDKYFEFFDI